MMESTRVNSHDFTGLFGGPTVKITVTQTKVGSVSRE